MFVYDFDSGVNFCGQFFAGTSFCGLWRNPRKNRKNQNLQKFSATRYADYNNLGHCILKLLLV